ncbi:MAG TPA: response regulator [Pyrinomonadaceae bacterium]|jgi:signal transduction histidine kinase
MSKVLLVDDEPSIRWTMSEFLKRAGYEVLAAADYESAAMVTGAGLDVAVIDINLPRKSGIELLRELQSREPYIPVIMITGEPNLSQIPEIVRAGAYDFIAKPVVKDVLLKAVGRAMERKRLVDEKRRLEQQIKRHAEELEVRVAERTAELVEAHKRLAHQEKIAALGRMAAQVAHEVKNPLAGLRLYALHLKTKLADKTPETELRLLDKIIETIDHLSGTAEQILNFARPVTHAPARVQLNRVVESALQLLEPQIAENKIEVELRLDDADTTWLLDEAAIRSTLINLMLNAVQSMPDGGQLVVTTEKHDGHLLLVINDTGRGMDSEQVENMFEPFYTTKSKGLGLGMPFAQKVIKQHGGAIRVESRAGAGTRIEVELPAAESNSQDGQDKEVQDRHDVKNEK